MRIRKKLDFSRSPKGCLRVVHFSECPPARKSTFHALADAVSRATQAEAAARYFFEITRQPVGLNASGDSFTRLEWFLLPRVTRVLFQSFQPLVFSTPKCPLFSIDRSIDHRFLLLPRLSRVIVRSFSNLANIYPVICIAKLFHKFRDIPRSARLFQLPPARSLSSTLSARARKFSSRIFIHRS